MKTRFIFTIFMLIYGVTAKGIFGELLQDVGDVASDVVEGAAQVGRGAVYAVEGTAEAVVETPVETRRYYGPPAYYPSYEQPQPMQYYPVSYQKYEEPIAETIEEEIIEE